MATRKRPAKKARSKQARSQKTQLKKTQVPGTTARRPRKSKPGAARAGGADSSDERVAQIQQVIDLMVRNGAVEVEMEAAGRRLRVRLKEDFRPATLVAQPPPVSHPEVIPSPPVSPSPAGAAGENRLDEAQEGEVFASPMVGTFYRAPAPDAEPFVEVGERVTADTTLCVIEAMKVMNEIKAETEGQIAAILVENGEPVEFGQPLFRITP